MWLVGSQVKTIVNSNLFTEIQSNQQIDLYDYRNIESYGSKSGPFRIPLRNMVNSLYF